MSIYAQSLPSRANDVTLLLACLSGRAAGYSELPQGLGPGGRRDFSKQTITPALSVIPAKVGIQKKNRISTNEVVKTTNELDKS